MALKNTVLASSVLAVWLGRGREHPACLHILCGCEVVHVGAQAHVHAQPFRKLSYAAPKVQSWTTVCNNIKWRLKRSTFPVSLWVACVPLLLLGERWVCLRCGDNDVSTAPDAWLPHSLAVVYPLSLLGITSDTICFTAVWSSPGCYQRSYSGWALWFCHVSSATDRGLFVCAVS